VRRTNRPASGKAQLDTTILVGVRDAPFFTDAERAALALTKAVTGSATVRINQII